jgi:hypothetical protein
LRRPFTVLGGAQDQARTAHSEGAPYLYRPILQVYVLPFESEQFTLPHAGVYGQHVQSFETIAAGRFEETPHLLRTERPHLFRGRSRRVDGFADVAWDHVPLYGLAQSLVQGHVELINTSRSEPSSKSVLIKASEVGGVKPR